MVETVTQIFGLTFVGIIMICLGILISQYIYSYFTKRDPNDKLLDNMKKLDKKNGIQ